MSAPGASEPAAQSPPAPATSGGKLHGLVKSGNIPLPGVTVTAQNTLTGKRFSTTTDITGAWTLTIPQNGRYVLRTQFAGFAPGSQEAVLNAASRDQTVSFDLLLASRAAQQQESESGESASRPVSHPATDGQRRAEPEPDERARRTETESQAGPSGAAGAALPSIAGNSDFGRRFRGHQRPDRSGESAGRPGHGPRPRCGGDAARAGSLARRAEGGGNFGGGGGGGFGGRRIRRIRRTGGFGGGGRGNFRGFNPGQPHGAIFWIGSNSALNAEPFSLRGQAQQQPPSGTNRFGITFMSAPYLPGLTKPSGKDMMFLTLSGQRSSIRWTSTRPCPRTAASEQPTSARESFRGWPTPVTPVTAATNLLQFFPAPNLPGYAQNYHLLTTAQIEFDAGRRALYAQPGQERHAARRRPRRLRRRRGARQQNQGLRQSINFNYNWSDSAADNVNVFPQLGGKSSSNANSVQAGYTVGYHKLTNIFNANWNRSHQPGDQLFHQQNRHRQPDWHSGPLRQCIGRRSPLNSSPLNYGLPNVTLSSFTGLNEQQPSFSLSQTISLSEMLSWIHGKHNLRFGGDYRRVHRDFLGGSNSTGTFYFHRPLLPALRWRIFCWASRRRPPSTPPRARAICAKTSGTPTRPTTGARGPISR